MSSFLLLLTLTSDINHGDLESLDQSTWRLIQTKLENL